MPLRCTAATVKAWHSCYKWAPTSAPAAEGAEQLNICCSMVVCACWCAAHAVKEAQQKINKKQQSTRECNQLWSLPMPSTQLPSNEKLTLSIGRRTTMLLSSLASSNCWPTYSCRSPFALAVQFGNTLHVHHTETFCECKCMSVQLVACC